MRLDALHGIAHTPLLEYELDGRHFETELDHSYQLGSCSDSTLTSDAQRMIPHLPIGSGSDR